MLLPKNSVSIQNIFSLIPQGELIIHNLSNRNCIFKQVGLLIKKPLKQ